MTSVAQLVFRDMMENHQDLTSYSWRRLAPSMATLMSLSQTELLALGEGAGESKHAPDYSNTLGRRLPPMWSNQP